MVVPKSKAKQRVVQAWLRLNRPLATPWNFLCYTDLDCEGACCNSIWSVASRGFPCYQGKDFRDSLL